MQYGSTLRNLGRFDHAVTVETVLLKRLCDKDLDCLVVSDDSTSRWPQPRC